MNQIDVVDISFDAGILCILGAILFPPSAWMPWLLFAGVVLILVAVFVRAFWREGQ